MKFYKISHYEDFRLYIVGEKGKRLIEKHEGSYTVTECKESREIIESISEEIDEEEFEEEVKLLTNWLTDI